MQLSDAIARWWVLDDDHHGRRREASLWASTGHAAAVFGDELYDVLAQTRGGYGRLQDFGIRFGYERVVLHLQPRVEAGRLRSNTARTQLLLEHEPLPWTRWGEEFAAAMPAEILRLQERAASADGVPRREAIRNRVTPILALYRLSRYRATRHPTQSSARSKVGSTTGGRASWAPIDGEASGAPIADGVRSASDIDDVRGRVGEQHSANEPCPAPMVDLPNVAWISARDGSRAPGDLEDQAARYHPARHELTINADFRAISDLITHWQDRYKGVPGARAVIEAHVREWCEQILVEVVLAARASTWSAEQLEALLSPTAFTVALLPRHLLYAILQKRLAQKLGPPHATATR